MRHVTYREQKSVITQMQRRQVAKALLAAKANKQYLQPGAKRISAIEKPPPVVTTPKAANE